MESSPENDRKICNEDRIKAGIALYTKSFLYIYDWFALGYGCRFLWECPSRHMLEMYNKHITANHLDIGVGTGYFMDKCSFPTANPRLALMDLNPNPLHVASKRLARYNPEVYQRNVLESFDIDAPPYDSIGMMNLLHCLPGDMNTKEIVLTNAREVLNHGGIVFGSTILYKGVKRNSLATIALRISNRRGTMTNMGDDVEVFSNNLGKHFSEHTVRVIGCEALFWAKR